MSTDLYRASHDEGHHVDDDDDDGSGLTAAVAAQDGEDGNEGAGPRTEAAKEDEMEPTATIFTTMTNMTSNVVGGGILSIPMAFAEMSVFPGAVVLAMMGLLSTYSILVLTLVSTHTGAFSYKELFQLSFKSPRAAKVLDALIMAYTFGVLVAFARIVGDSMPDVSRSFLKAHGAPTTSWFWILLAAVIFFPLSSLKQLSELKISSAAGFLSILYVVAVIIVRFFDATYEQEGNRDGIVADDTPWFEFRTTFLSAVPLCSVAFCCHYNIPVFYGEMARRTPHRMMKAVAGSVPLIFVLYLITGLCGVMQFGGSRIIHKSQGDVLNNFAEDDTPMNIGRLGMFIHFVCVYPIVCIACRRSVNMVLFNQPLISRRGHILEAFALVVTSCVIAYLVPDVSTIFAINGAAFGLAIVMVLPNLFYLRILPPPGQGRRWARGAAGMGHSEDLAAGGVMTADGGDGEEGAQPHHEQEMCDLTTASHDAFFGEDIAKGAQATADDESDSAVAAWLVALCQEQHWLMRRASQVLVVFGVVLAIACLIITAISKF